MKKTFITALALIGAVASVHADGYKGSTPKSGETYSLYNVGKKQFLGTEGDRLVLGGEKVEVTLDGITDTNTPGFFRITSAGKVLGAQLWGTPSIGGGKFSDWRIEPVAGKSNVYTISSRNTEASASFYIYQNSVYDRIAAMPVKPNTDFESAQWLLVATADVDTPVYTFSEDDSQYERHDDGKAEVHVARKFNLNQWNAFCSPVDISAEQVASQFGAEARVAEFTGFSGEDAKFTSVASVKAGTPYIVYVTNQPSAGYYTINGDLLFAAEAASVYHDGITFQGTFTNGSVDGSPYVMDKNSVLTRSASGVVGMSGYLKSPATTVIRTWSLDGVVTGVVSVGVSSDSRFDIYNTGGQKVKTGASDTKNLDHGVYIVKGKKISK